jgi:hypothetical protein
MESFLGSAFSKTTLRLEADLILLRKLLYRNRHQHGNTLAFSYCRRVSRYLSLEWRKESLILLQQSSIELLRLQVGEMKITTEMVEKVMLNTVAVTMFISSGTKALNFAVKAHTALGQLLRKQVFLPLFTILWSLVAKIFRSVKEIVLPLHDTHQHLTSLVQVCLCLMTTYIFANLHG